MTIKELEEKLYAISKHLEVITASGKPFTINYVVSDHTSPIIYDFENAHLNYETASDFLTNDDIDKINKAINSYYAGKGNKTLDNQSDNPFKPYTDKLAKTLLEKNKAYGDSFTKSIEVYGLRVVGVRLSDKYNRIEHLVTNDEIKENDESLEDTLLDMAGYSILALKHLKEKHHEE